MSRCRCRHCGAVLVDDDWTRRHEQRCPLAHTCRHCGALPGKRCRSPLGVATLHRVREHLAEALAPA